MWNQRSGKEGSTVQYGVRRNDAIIYTHTHTPGQAGRQAGWMLFIAAPKIKEKRERGGYCIAKCKAEAFFSNPMSPSPSPPTPQCRERAPQYVPWSQFESQSQPLCIVVLLRVDRGKVNPFDIGCIQQWNVAPHRRRPFSPLQLA